MVGLCFVRRTFDMDMVISFDSVSCSFLLKRVSDIDAVVSDFVKEVRKFCDESTFIVESHKTPHMVYVKLNDGKCFFMRNWADLSEFDFDGKYMFVMQSLDEYADVLPVVFGTKEECEKAMRDEYVPMLDNGETWLISDDSVQIDGKVFMGIIPLDTED